MISTYTAVVFIVSLAAPLAYACVVDNLKGTCMEKSACAGRTVAGKCAGAANIQCCLPTGTSCSASGKSGVCVDVGSCAGTAVSGLCPGAANIKCCVASGGSAGSPAGLCGSYAGSEVKSIAGNDNVMYSVVKIRSEHLTTPSSASLSPTDSDNTMTTTTACAFDQMATAAKAAGVSVKISSGFRTIARQNYFWNCYQTKSCNNGNLAARPGTSNHGKGIALDLNTDCGKQAGAKPNCGGSAVYQWLYNNAHNYGFTRTVQSEPWHWEFRGVGVARASFS
ncbi:unnamed protein product [Adineta ricciae]|uniref:D-alanyl-D-alanine carboxypeptidase-like core domain-containing protein n=1 Tax=Adineta ricciae TaxID=249248 RepID=A0A814WDR1_ADIRI|nr:unnamed protein product [Adineta ricciae]CAF1448761.1 unnamed protein product [Adineta ricciae]